MVSAGTAERPRPKPKKNHGRQPNSGGVLSVASGSLPTGFLQPSDEWLRARWVEVAMAIKTGDEDSVFTALKVIYDVAPDEMVRDIARRYLSGKGAV